MSKIILDISGGNTHKNNEKTALKMIDAIKAIDTEKHEIVFKTQLFKEAPPNIPIDHGLFDVLFKYCKKAGYALTSSVFDFDSLCFLLKYDPVFVKIANNRRLDWLIGEVPRRIPVYVSMNLAAPVNCRHENVVFMVCVSEYPAQMADYDKQIRTMADRGIAPRGYHAISDHTVGLELFNKYKPAIWEKHFKLEDSTGLDAGPFAVTPEELGAIL